VVELKNYNHKVTNTSGFDIRGFMPASLDAKPKKTKNDLNSSCDEASLCSNEICCVFDNNVEEQEKKIIKILKQFD